MRDLIGLLWTLAVWIVPVAMIAGAIVIGNRMYDD
jgi:hypothetical protein